MGLYAILLLGLVIFIHELGHFLCARLFNVKVEIFSLGFGKAVVKYTHGETEYRISLIPLGGYVKMLGENFNEDAVPKELEHRSFSHKKWWQKVFIVVAGPLANILFAVVLYFFISFYNHVDDAPIIEYLTPGSPAQTSGLKEGDEILKINGESIFVWEDIQTLMPVPVNGKCEDILVVYKKAFSDLERSIVVKPERKERQNLFGEKKEKCVIGIAAIVKDTRVAFTGEHPSLQNGDFIRKVGNEKVEKYYEIQNYLKNDPETVTIERGGKEIIIPFDNQLATFLQEHMKHGGMVVSSVDKESISEEMGLNISDFLYRVDKRIIASPFEFRSYLHSLDQGDSVTLEVYRNGVKKIMNFNLSVVQKDNDYTGMKDKNIKWGAKFSFDYSLPTEKTERNNPLLYSFKFAVSETLFMTHVTLKGLYLLATGSLPAKSLGGPLMVFDISTKAAKKGVKVFLAVMAMISVNLGLINLFPIPILDGGHVMMYTFEGVSGRSINRRTKEKMITVGFFLLMLIMVYAFVNDITRYFSIFSGGQ